MMKKKEKNAGLVMGARHFGIAFVVFVAIMTGIGLLVVNMGGCQLFSEEEGTVTQEEFHLVSIVDSDNPFFNEFSESKRINTLLLGVNPPLTDTIMLASFEPDLGKVDLISVPRDTYYERAGAKGANLKINAVYKSEPVNTARAVSDVLQGMPIHYYAVIDFEGIEKIVESMGGIPMNVPFHMYYTDEWAKPALHIDIPEGYQVLNGEESMKFLRFRKGNPGYPGYPRQDIGRMEAQQEFLRSAFQQSVGHLPSVVKSVFSNVKSNVDLKTALAIAGKAASMGGEDIISHSLPGTDKNIEVSQGKSLSFCLQDVEATKEMIKEIYEISEETTTGGGVTSENKD